MALIGVDSLQNLMIILFVTYRYALLDVLLKQHIFLCLKYCSLFLFQTSSRLFFVIEFVRGGDLMFHMQRQRRLPEEHARSGTHTPDVDMLTVLNSVPDADGSGFFRRSGSGL